MSFHRELVLDGAHVFEQGKDLGPLSLVEGQRSKRMTIIERFSGSWANLHQVPLTETVQKAVQEAGQSSGVLMVLEGRYQMADTLNANGRIYPNNLWEEALSDNSKSKERLRAGEMLSELDHPTDGETRLNRVVGMMTDYWRSENNSNEIMGRMAIFNTEAGRQLKGIVEGGGRVGVSSRGQGSVVRLEGKDVVQDDFVLETWDVVHNPSTPGAYPDITSEGSSLNTMSHCIFPESQLGTALTITSTGSSKESKMSQLVDLQERFRRLQERDLSALSPDARKITLEEATSLRKKLTETQWGTHEVTGAVSLTADVASFCRDVKDSGITESDSEKFIVLVNGEKVHGPCSRKEAMEFVDKENKAQQAKNDYVEIRVEPVAELQLSSRWEATDDDEDDESTEPVEESEDRSQAVRDHGTGKKRLKVGDRVGDSTVTDVNDQTVSFKTDDGYSSSIQIPFVDNGDTMTLSGAIAYGKYSRPTKAEAVVEALTSLYPISLDADIVEATAGARAAYRSAFKIEGPLTQEETRGVARYVSSGPRVGTAQVGVRGTLKAAKAFKKLPSQISEAIVEKKSASHVVIEAKTSQERASIEEALLKYSSPVLLVWDEREQIVQECAQRYAPLLEAQTLKTLSESARTAGSQAEITELSAKNQASRQVLHVLARRARLAEDRIVVLGDRLEAAQSLAEALVQELSAERLRGAVEGIAATQKDPKVVSEVAQASSLEEAVAITRKLTKKSGPLIEREPVTSEDVLALSEEVRSVTEKRLSQKDVPSSRGVTPTATMNTVVGAIRRAGGK